VEIRSRMPSGADTFRPWEFERPEACHSRARLNLFNPRQCHFLTSPDRGVFRPTTFAAEWDGSFY
jgi:hypothetical protein